MAGLAAAMVGCGLLPAPAGPTPTLAATPTPTPVPTPRLLLLGVPAGSALGASLVDWAGQRGWLTDAFEAGQAGLEAGLTQPGLQAVVGLGWSAGLQSAFSGPLIVVDAPDATIGPRLSVVGEPGARHDQVGFLAGVLAGLVSRTERVALLTETGGAHESIYQAAFDHGLRYGCPRCALIRLAAAQASAQAVAGEGADAAFAVPGPAAAAALVPLAEAGLWVVWSGSEPAPLPETRLAGEIRMLPEALAAPALTALLDGQPGTAWPYSVESRSIAVGSLNSEALSPGRELRLQQAWEGLASGELQIGVDPLTGAES